MSIKPAIGVSACLAGRPVRPDGKDKHVPWLTETLAEEATLVSICPEIEMGLGVPRERIDFETRGDRERLVGLSSGRDLTDCANAAARRLLAGPAASLDGYVFKKNSASCGIVKSGLFARAVMRRHPALPVIEEDALADEDARRAFLRRVRAYAAVRRRFANDPSVTDERVRPK